MNFLFWNIRKNENVFGIIRELVYSEDIDILMIAEYPNCSTDGLLNVINSNPALYKYEHHEKQTQSDKIEIFTRFSANFITPLKDTQRISAKEITSTLLNHKITIVTCHFPSKVNMTDDQLSEYASDARDFIDEVEKQTGHQHTIICGDFNMNPFDNGIIKTKGLHAIMDKSIAQKRKIATVRGKDYPYLYNPMWELLGNSEICGTMYYNSSDSINYYWHIYDQVLIRPDLIDSFNIDGLKIITKTNQSNFLTLSGLLNKNISDHLPIKFNLKI